MANDLATLKGHLDTQLADTGNTVWGTTEKNNLITWAVAGLWPRLGRVFDPTSTTVTLVEGTYFYSLPTGAIDVSRIDWKDTGDVERGTLVDGSWELVGDPLMGTGKLHVSPAYADAGGTLRLHAYGRFDTSTNLIPDDYVPLVLAIARAEAYRRVAGDRSRFKIWLARHQGQNTSVNELAQLVGEATREAERLRSQFKTWRRPMPARV